MNRYTNPERLHAAGADRLPDRLLLELTAQDFFAQYVDDLQAANRFKTFLLGVGVEIPAELTLGLAGLLEQLTSEAVFSSLPPVDSGAVAPKSGYSTGDPSQ
jgi:hypothetical protein